MNLFGTNKEQQIIRRFGKGDARAMDLLYAQYADYLTGVAARYLANREDLRDVLQESFIKIFTKFPSFQYRGSGSLQAWLTRVVVNESLLFLRQRHPEMLANTETEPPDVPDEEPDVGAMTAEALMEMIARLPTGYRTVFNLYAVEGKSHKEIAEILGIRPDTSASQFHKARNLLARMIKEQRNKEERP